MLLSSPVKNMITDVARAEGAPAIKSSFTEVHVESCGEEESPSMLSDTTRLC